MYVYTYTRLLLHIGLETIVNDFALQLYRG